jgi:UTP--glucose-1-phosphate uridylyltransferase
MLPATKAIPKELLPVYDAPLLQYALDEACAAGAERIVLVSHPDKRAIERYLAPDEALETSLRRQGKMRLLDRLRACQPEGVEVIVTYQDAPLGLGHAVLCAAGLAGPGPVGVILPDDLILGRPCLAEMAEAWQAGAMSSLVAAQDVPRDSVASYGVFDLPAGDAGRAARAIPARGLVEKPQPAEAPSCLAAVGRYLLDDPIFDVLRGTGRGRGGEIQLTDAIAEMGGIHAFRFSGTRYDCGVPDGLVAAGLAVQSEGRAARRGVAAE